MPRPFANRLTGSALAAVRLGLLALLVLAPAAVRAQEADPAEPASPEAAATTTGAVAEAGGRGGHGWGIIRTGPRKRPTLVHLPPRRGPNAAARGTLGFAAWLGEEPERLATWKHRVYLVFPPLEPGYPRRVATLHAEQVIGGFWEMKPAGRLRILPALPGEGTLAGFTATGVGPAALLKFTAESGPAHWRLLVLRGHDWSDITIPPEAEPEIGDDPALVGTAEGVILLTRRSPGAVAWNVYIPYDGIGLWRRSEVRWGDAPPGGEIFALDGRLMRARAQEGGLALDLIRPGPGGGVYPLATLADVPHDAQLIPLDGAGALALLWPRDAAPATPLSPGRTEYRLREVTALSGRTLYDGAAAGASLIATQQYRLLAVVLMLVTVTVLLFILKPEDRPAPVLPAGVSLAEPGRRAAAAMADFLVGLLAASWITGVEATEVLGPSLLTASPGGLATFALALAIAWAQSSLGEWLAGRSIGKALAGCEVIRLASAPEAGNLVAQEGQVGTEGGGGDGGVSATRAAVAGRELLRPAIWQAMLRNLVRWGLPLIGVWLLIDAGGRHPGDLLARTVVIVRRSPDQNDADSRP